MHPAQLKALFEKSWESITGNCDEFLYLGGNEQSTHKYVSELLGKETLGVVNNLSDFIFGLIRAIGLILLGFGVMPVGLSLKSHDPSQRANGFLTLAGGIIITFTKEILALITGG